MKSMPLTSPPAVTFYDVYHSYWQQVVNQYDLPKRKAPERITNQIGTSTLSADEQRGFYDWLAQRCYLQMSVGNALRRGLLVEAVLVNPTIGAKAAYSVRIKGL